jgi:hypothetical protein
MLVSIITRLDLAVLASKAFLANVVLAQGASDSCSWSMGPTGNLIEGNCRRADQSYRTSQEDLNLCLENNNGNLVPGAG